MLPRLQLKFIILPYVLISAHFFSIRSIHINSRNSLGRNDNPNAVEFSSAFKKLIVCHPLTTSVDHNTITDATKILTVSSRKKNQPLPPVVENQVLELEIDYEFVMLTEIEESDRYEQHMCAYVALCVERNFIKNTKSHKYKCNECANLLLSENDKIYDELLAMKDEKEAGQIQQPSASTLKIIIFGNAVMKMYSNEEHHSINSMKVICKTITKNIDMNDLYKSDDFLHRELEESEAFHHKEEFVNFIIETFLALKSHKICKKKTDEEKGELIRFRKKREVILRGQ